MKHGYKVLLLLSIFLISMQSVFAWRDGDILTQSDLKLLDFKNPYLACRYEGYQLNEANTIIGFFTSCQELKEIENNQYLVFRHKINVFSLSIDQMIKCTNQNDSVFCGKEIIKTIIGRHYYFRRGIISKLLVQKVRNEPGVYDPEKVIIDNQELN